MGVEGPGSLSSRLSAPLGTAVVFVALWLIGPAPARAAPARAASARTAPHRAAPAATTAATTATATIATTATIDPCGLDYRKWTSTRTADGKARLWWPRGNAGDGAAARAYERDIDYVWPRFAGLLGRQPVRTHQPCLPIDDGRLQIFVDAAGRSNTADYDGQPADGPAQVYMVLRPGASRDVLAHELFHAFQAGFHYAEAEYPPYNRFIEGSATWAEYYAYPQDRAEFDIDSLLTTPHDSLDANNSEEDAYDTWLYMLYLSKTDGPSVIAKILRSFADAPVNAGVDRATNTFVSTWPKFALAAWNQAPDPAFKQWVGITSTPEQESANVTLSGANQATVTAPGDFPLAHLARDYTVLNVTDSRVRYIQFNNTLDGTRYASVQAFVKLADGQWSTQDWTDRSSIDFCRTNADQDVSEIVVVYGNSDAYAEDPIDPQSRPTLNLRAYCQVAQGTFSGQVQLPGEGLLAWTGTVSFATPAPPPFVDALEVTSGTVSWTLSGQDASGCTWNGSGTFSLTPAHDGAIQFYSGGSYMASLGTAPPDAMDTYALPAMVTCPDESPMQEYGGWGTWLQTPVAQASGNTLSGSYNYATADFSWNLTSYGAGG
jgi:hypothetical protein